MKRINIREIAEDERKGLVYIQFTDKSKRLRVVALKGYEVTRDEEVRENRE